MVDKFYFIKGGVERYFFELKQILEGYGHQVIPFSMHHPNNFKSEYQDYFIEHIELNHDSLFKKIVNAPKIVGRVIYSKEARNNIERLIEKVQPDIAHLHMIDHQISPSILHSLKKYNIPVVQTAHQYKLVCPNYRLYNPGKNEVCEKCLHGNYFHPIKEKCHQNSIMSGLLLTLETYIHNMMRIHDNIDIIHTPSDFMKSKLIEGGVDQNKIQKIHLSVNLEEYPFSPTYLDYFVYIGRLSDEKGLLTLLKAMKDVTSSRLLIIGDGPQRKELEEYVGTNGLSNVEFLGFMSPEEVRKVVAKSKFIVIPSEWYENSPVVIYEAFALGKPVIGASIGGITELVEHGENGFLFTPGNVDELKERICELVGDESGIQRMGKNARSKAENEFSPDKHYEQIYNLYKQLLDMNK